MSDPETETQLVFDLPHLSGASADDFFVSPTNREAVALLESWPDWPGGACVLIGPEGYGKSHLGAIWSARAGARAWPGEAGTWREMSTPVLVDDADRRDIPDVHLFHLVNAVREAGQSLLITARTPPSAWPVTLPDLASRLKAMPSAAIGAPDDELVGALLVKFFVDRQLDVAPPVISYLARRIDRSAAALRATVAAIDEASLRQNRKVTRALVAEILTRRGAIL
jgi:chromosomal replication initiation ATPase DnaA